MNFAEHFFTIPSYLERAGDLRLLWFANDHRAKLAANNPGGLYDVDLAAIDEAIGGFTESCREEDTRVNLRQAKTESLDDWKAEAMDFLSITKGLITYAFRENPPACERFYPHGMTEYRDATREELDLLLQRFLDVVQEYAAVLPPDVLTDIARIRAGYGEALSAQVAQKGEVSESRLSSSVSRITLEDQLMKNLHDIARNNLRRPKIVRVYFDLSIVMPKKHTAEEQVVSGTVEPMATEVAVQGDFTTGTTALVFNRGKTDLLFHTAAHPTDPLPANPVVVLPGKVVQLSLNSNDPPGHRYLMVHNPDPHSTGRYRLEVVNSG
jgi:hypothetical protein